jgi:hypothetical protein
VSGVAAGGAALLPLTRGGILLNPIITIPTNDEIETAIKIATNDAMLLETLGELEAIGFAFDLSLSTAQFPSK